jgi:hypothetical protein
MGAMEFVVEQPIAASRDDVEAAFLDPDFYRALGEIPDIAPPEVVDRHERDGVTELALRYRFTGHLAPAVKAVLDPNKLVWVQESTIDHHSHRTTFKMKPEHYGSRLECSGVYVFEPAADGSTVQRLTGRVKVHFPLVGGTVERAIVNGLKEHIASEAAIVERWIRERNPS